jgi:hypothetical protein
MEVTTHHGQRDVALEAVDAVTGTTVQTLYLERVDRRLDARVATTQPHEARAVLVGPLANLDRQRLPERLLLRAPQAVADWLGEGAHWRRALQRRDRLLGRCPALAPDAWVRTSIGWPTPGAGLRAPRLHRSTGGHRRLRSGLEQKRISWDYVWGRIVAASSLPACRNRRRRR